MVELQTKAALDGAVVEYGAVLESCLLKPLHPAAALLEAAEGPAEGPEAATPAGASAAAAAASEAAATALRMPVELPELRRLHSECEAAAQVSHATSLPRHRCHVTDRVRDGGAQRTLASGLKASSSGGGISAEEAQLHSLLLTRLGDLERANEKAR